MYRLLRRMSSTISSRFDKAWNGDNMPSTSGPQVQVGSKRRRDDDDDDMGVSDECGMLVGTVSKRSRLGQVTASEEPGPAPSPSPSQSSREGTPEITHPKDGEEAREATSVTEGEVEEKPLVSTSPEETAAIDEGEKKESNEEVIGAVTQVEEGAEESVEQSAKDAESASPEGKADATVPSEDTPSKDGVAEEKPGDEVSIVHKETPASPSKEAFEQMVSNPVVAEAPALERAPLAIEVN